MTYQKKSRIVAITTIVLIMLYSVFIVKIEFFDERPHVVVANGVITGKYESDYSCGSKGKYTCYSRYLTINGKNHPVNLETFTTKKIGDSVVLTIPQESQLSFTQKIIMVIGSLMWLALISIAACVLIMFLWWSCFYSERQSFSEYMD